MIFGMDIEFKPEHADSIVEHSKIAADDQETIQ